MRDVVDRLQDTVGRMAEQMQTLVRLEIQLAKTEMAEKAKAAAMGAAFFIAAGVLLFFSVFGLLIALIWAIGEFLPIWAGGADRDVRVHRDRRPAGVHRPAQRQEGRAADPREGDRERAAAAARDQGGGVHVTNSDELREEARVARENLVATVGELGDTVQLAKTESISAAKKYGPIAAGVLGALVLVKVLRR